MRIYLSGPMTGLPDWNYPAFKAAAERLRALGHTVYNPADSTRSTATTPRAEFLRDDLALIAGCAWEPNPMLRHRCYPPAEAICLLPGWERSAGARMELHVALELGLTVFEDTLPNHLIVGVCDDDARAQLLDAVVSAWAPKGIELNEDARDLAEMQRTLAESTKRIPWDEVKVKLGIPTTTTTPPAAPESAAQEAHRLVHGNRGADYGHPIEDFTRTAALWTAQFRDLLKDGAAFTFREVWQAMCLVKMSRERNKPKRDNRVDLAGYAETGQMCEDEAARRKEAA